MKQLLFLFVLPAYGQTLVSVVPSSWAGTSGAAATFLIQNGNVANNSYQLDFAPTSASFAQNQFSPGHCGLNVVYNPGFSRVSVAPDAGGPVANQTFATSAPLESGWSGPSNVGNSQCNVWDFNNGSSITPSGNDLQVTLRVDFSTNYQGPKNLWWTLNVNGGGGPPWSGPFVLPGTSTQVVYYIGVYSESTISQSSGVLPQLMSASMVRNAGTENIALGRHAQCSSTYANGVFFPQQLTDGNTNGNWTWDYTNSTAITNADNYAWCQIDLGNPGTSMSSVTLWNGTACCQNRLSDYWVFVSDTPFLNTDTPSTLSGRANTWASHQCCSYPNPSVNIPVNSSGRYVRVQLNNQNYLELAEVQVFGTQTQTISSQYYYVGDSTTYSATGPPNQIVNFLTYVNGINYGGTTINLDNNGTTTGSYTMTGSGGFYYQLWAVAGTSVGPLYWVIIPTNAPLPRFSIVNNTRGGTAAWRVGDSYHIELWGSPGATVARNGLFNYMPFQQGASNWITFQLDSTGHWAYDGVIQSGDVGDWVASWTVNGVPAGQPYTYSVSN